MRLLRVTCYTGREAAARGGLDRGAAAHGEGAARSPPLHPTHHQAVFRIRIHRIHMFLGLPDPDPFVRGMDLDPDPSVIMQK
jgi:hypothetical protein